MLYNLNFTCNQTKSKFTTPSRGRKKEVGVLMKDGVGAILMVAVVGLSAGAFVYVFKPEISEVIKKSNKLNCFSIGLAV